jgi:hypothetical protein
MARPENETVLVVDDEGDMGEFLADVLKDIPLIVSSGVAGRDTAVSRSVPVFDQPIDEKGLLNAAEQVLG